MNCSRCERTKKDVMALVKVSDECYICSKCISELNTKLGAVVQDKTENRNKKKQTKIPSAKEMVEHLNQYIVGQDDAKKTLSIAVRNHFKRISMASDERKDISKSNVMIIGPSGTGKTELVRRLAEYVDIPMIVVDANSFTSAGYTGDDVESMIVKLYNASGNNKDNTEHGIIFIDEIDKKKKEASQASQKDIGGEEVQKSLLKIIEGRDVKINNAVTIDTSNILFISAGAFVNLDKIVKTRMSDTSVGFLSPTVNANIADQVTNEDLFKFGMIPEFIGRFPITAYTNELTDSELFTIATTPKTSAYKQYKKLFQMDNVELVIEDAVIEDIIKQVKKDKVGVRGIQKHFDNLLKEHQYNLESYHEQNIQKITFYMDDGVVKFKVAKRRGTKKLTVIGG